MNSGTVKHIIAAIILVLCGASSAIWGPERPQHARLSLISEHSSAAPGSTQWIGLRFQLDSGWHIYWTNPGDSGEPPKATWHLPNRVQAGDLQFPIPQRIQDHGLTDYGYQGDVVLLSKIQIPDTGMSGKIEIAADVRYLVCREVCVPGKDHVSMTLPAGKSAMPSAESELIRIAAARLPQALPKGVHASATSAQDTFLLTVTGKPANFGSVRDFIPADAQLIENTTRPEIRDSATASLIRLKKSEQINQSVSQLRGLLIAGDSAYNVAVPITSAKKSSQTGSAQKHVPLANQRANKE